MPGIGSLLDIGKKSLFASQSAIEVVGNNISNANTEGYSRQAVRLTDGAYLDYRPGQLGTGVQAAEVLRYFDEFVEAQFITKSSDEKRWGTLFDSLQSVEGLFNEANADGINAALTQFWNDWQTLATDPKNTSIRTALLGHASALERIIQGAAGELRHLQEEADERIGQDVDTVNRLLSDIADVNSKITIYEETGKNNANGLRDQRAGLIRQLSEKMDVQVIDNGLGNMTVLSRAGHTLVDGSQFFRLSFEAPQTVVELDSNYSGALRFEGTGAYEYSVDMLTPGSVQTGGVVGPATFRISVDGGRTWLADADGNTRVFTAGDYDHRVLLPDGEVSLYFENGPGSNTLSAEDNFTVLPKKSVFWHKTSSSKVNVTSQILPNGEDNERRLLGGSITGHILFRDESVGGYLERLDAFASSLAWEVNRIHSQGAGLERFQRVDGTYQVTNTTEPLGAPESGFPFGSRLLPGNATVHVYNTVDGSLEATQTLDFGGNNFDPAVHSLEDVRQAFDNIEGLQASIVDGRLRLKADSGQDFAFGTDSSGLLAGLGLNTFFVGSDARTLSVSENVRTHSTFVNTGRVNGAGEMNAGDNATAARIAAMQHTAVSVRTISGGSTKQALGEYYSTLVAKIGSETSNARFTHDFQAALAADLKARQDAVSGVNLDEEMTSLIKFQHAYTAAAKMITTADSMLDVLLGLKV